MNDFNGATRSVTSKVPQVSIGMPVYNGAKFIHEALDSLLLQTFTDFELIISDNASTDETEVICREYAAKDERIRYVRQVENLGATANFQFVLDEAVGEYFMWAAHDDVQDSCLLESLLPVFNEDYGIVLVVSDIENIDQHNKSTGHTHLNNIRVESAIANREANRILFFRNPTTNIFFSIYGLFIRNKLKNIELNYKGMVKFSGGSEIPLLAQLSLKGLIVSIPKSLKKYRRHPSSIFHKELANASFLFHLKNKINISWILFVIATKSELILTEKLQLILVISYDALKISILFFLRPFVRVARYFLKVLR